VSEVENKPIPAGETRPTTMSINNADGEIRPTLQGYSPLPADRVTVAPGVLLTVIRMGALHVAGVVKMGNTPGGVNAWMRRTPTERGVQVIITDHTVNVDVYIIADGDANLREVSYNVQWRVARAIEENVGMHIGAINIHIEDVIFEPLSQIE
jgi:uncharacterized alkaline shock family protein YloU